MKLLINESPQMLLPSLALIAGLNEAIVLQQLHWLCQNHRDAFDHGGELWVKRTYREWIDGCFPYWSLSTVKRIFESLRSQQLVIEASHPVHNLDKALSFRVNYGQLLALENQYTLPLHNLALAPGRRSVNMTLSTAQNDTLDGSEWPRRQAQPDTADGVNLTPSALSIRLQERLEEKTTPAAGAPKCHSEPSAAAMPWQPDPETVAALALQGVPLDFATSPVVHLEFYKYWHEIRAVPVAHLDHRFLNHAKRGWVETQSKEARTAQAASRGRQQAQATRARSLEDDLTDRSWALNTLTDQELHP